MSIQWLPLVWSPEPWLTVRRTASLSAMLRLPRHQLAELDAGHVGRIAPNGPRNCATASGFGSHVSMCPGPPLSQNRMTLVSGAADFAWRTDTKQIGQRQSADTEQTGLNERAT